MFKDKGIDGTTYSDRTSLALDTNDLHMLNILRTHPDYEGRTKKWIIGHLIKKEMSKLNLKTSLQEQSERRSYS
ncbi:MAG: hypothetical protein ACPKPY_12775 [Nitrososphaeraceae archaeon]